MAAFLARRPVSRAMSICTATGQARLSIAGALNPRAGCPGLDPSSPSADRSGAGTCRETAGAVRQLDIDHGVACHHAEKAGGL